MIKGWDVSQEGGEGLLILKICRSLSSLSLLITSERAPGLVPHATLHNISKCPTFLRYTRWYHTYSVYPQRSTMKRAWHKYIRGRAAGQTAKLWLGD